MVAARPFFPPVAAISSSRRPKSTCSPTSRRMITFSRSFSVLMNAFWPLKRSARAEACFHFSRVAASSFCAASVALDASSTTSRHARSTSVSVRSESSVSSRTCALFSCASARSFSARSRSTDNVKARFFLLTSTIFDSLASAAGPGPPVSKRALSSATCLFASSSARIKFSFFFVSSWTCAAGWGRVRRLDALPSFVGRR